MRVIVILSALLFTSPVWAQDVGVEKCHTYAASDQIRLACYDKATGFSGAPVLEKSDADAKPVEKPPVVKGDWQVSTLVSDLDDSTNVYLKLTSEDEIAGRFSGSGPMVIHIQCRENKTLLYIYFNGLHMSDYQYGTVTYRLDSQKAQKKKMQESTDHSALGLWNGGASIPFVKAMFGHEKLLVQATPYSESAVTATFSISGLEDAIKPLRTSCNW